MVEKDDQFNQDLGVDSILNDRMMCVVTVNLLINLKIKIIKKRIVYSTIQKNFNFTIFRILQMIQQLAKMNYMK